MRTKSVVRLTAAEREVLNRLIQKRRVSSPRVSSPRVRRAQILLNAAAAGPNGTDAEIAEAFDCRTQTVANPRERFVTEGFETAVDGKPTCRVRRKVLDGGQEATIIAWRLGQPPNGFAHRTLRRLAEQAIVLAIVESVRHETLRRALKKTG